MSKTKRIYLDYNASTPIDPRVAEAVAWALQLRGNPSSIHREGREARSLVDEARASIAALLRCDHRGLIFTSGGTESNNLGVLGFARANRAKGNHIITTAIEHSAVLNSCHQLEREGFEITYVAPSREGMIDPAVIEAAFKAGTILVSVMLANNEIGTIQPVREIADRARAIGIVTHTDAVQAFGKIDVSPQDLGVDLLSVSAHKIYGPKGAGALYCAAGLDLQPLLRGGSHERGLRAGTENAPAIHGFGVAARLLNEEGLPELLPLRQQLEEGLARTNIRVLCASSPRLPNTVNFYSETWPGESMVMAFDLDGFAVSNGSACAAGVIEPSHVILALGYNELVARSVIRISLGKWTRPADIVEFLGAVQKFETIGPGVRA